MSFLFVVYICAYICRLSLSLYLSLIFGTYIRGSNTCEGFCCLCCLSFIVVAYISGLYVSVTLVVYSCRLGVSFMIVACIGRL